MLEPTNNKLLNNTKQLIEFGNGMTLDGGFNIELMIVIFIAFSLPH